MTSICPSGGTSSPKPAVAEFISITSAAAALALQRAGASKLQFVIPLLSLAPLEVSPFCATDPPALPTFTSDEVFSMLRVGLDADYFSGIAKARDLLLRFLWYDLCQCDTPSATPFVPPTLPTDTPDPILPFQAAAAACATAGPISRGFTNGNGTFNRGQVTLTSLGHPTLARMTIQNQLVSGAGWTLKYTPRFDTSGSPISMPQISTPVNTTSVHDYDITSTMAALEFNGTTNAATGTGVLNEILTAQIFCDGSTPGTPQACCPLDPATQQTLDLILRMVTLIQRQSAPFGYVAGASHTGLTGHGSFATSGLLGVAVDVTFLPGSYGRSVGSPEHLFSAGWVTLGTADGYETSHPISSDGSLIIPRLGGIYTALGYTLNPGVVVTLKELVREP